MKKTTIMKAAKKVLDNQLNESIKNKCFFFNHEPKKPTGLKEFIQNNSKK